jgi:excisionase family DNA binding protein
MAMSTEHLTLSEREACRLLRRGRLAVKSLIADGKLKTVTLGGREVITRASLDAYLGTAQAPAPAALDGITQLIDRRVAEHFERFAQQLRGAS